MRELRRQLREMTAKCQNYAIELGETLGLLKREREESRELRNQLEAVTKALKDQPCRCRCLTHGFGCGIEEATCRKDRTYKCSRCAALAKIGGNA